MQSFSEQVQSLIKYRKIRLMTLDGTQAATQHLNRNLPGAAILGLINKEMGVFKEKDFEQRFKKILEKKLGAKRSKGKEVIESNLSLLRFGVEQSSTTCSPERWSPASLALETEGPVYAAPLPEDFGGKKGSAGLPVTLTEKDELGTIKPVNLIKDYQKTFEHQMIEPILEGRKVPWDHFLPVVPAATSRFRDMSYIGTQLPVYDPAKCIACGICTASCPDSAICSTVTDQPIPGEAQRYFKVFKKPPKGIPWERFAMNLEADPASCKGCGVCARVCPTDALQMVDKNQGE